ncbi:MAG: glycoside hydrolase family 2 TIM barrel-domain containing protein [Candidatus Ornithomonoglobus sp.]
MAEIIKNKNCTAPAGDSGLPGGLGEYFPNDLDLSYISIFENDGIEKVVRDSVIGGKRSSMFNDGWRFYKTQDISSDCSTYDYDDSAWSRVTLPHDFQVLQKGNMGGRYAMLRDIKGWYRKSFTLPEKLSGKRISIRFDGIYQASEIFINGHALPEYGEENSPYSGTHYYGYKTFEVDLSDYVHFGRTPNVIAVSVKDQHTNSRWYTGAGINRNVWLTVSGRVHIPLGGTYVSYSLNKDYSRAEVKAVTELRNRSGKKAAVTVKQKLFLNGEMQKVMIESVFADMQIGEEARVEHSFTIDNPVLWGISDDEAGSLYSLRTEIFLGGEITDTYISEFGIRDIEWKKDRGVYLNGERIKLQGVCEHENLGSLGSANNAAALERQIVILKKMGVNAIRTAHNPCTPELITICNRLGMLVLEEAFDSWDDTKDGEYSPGGQGIFLDTYESDIRAMVRRDRNAPCVFMWSIGNEILQTVWGSMEETWYKIENMLNFIHDEDPRGRRYVTLAQMQWTTDFSRRVSARICDYFGESFGDYGVMGENYREYYMDLTHKQYPDYRYVSTESSSAVRSRGVYHEGRYVYSHDDLQVSCLDNAGPAYYISAEDLYKFDTNRGWYAGQFIWTGFDYIGEPTPYDTKNSYFGIVDTAGLPKDIYYFYRSAWNKKEDTVHILPPWEKNDGDSINVRVYSNAERVDLYYVPEEGSGYEPQHLTDTIRWKDHYEEEWNICSKPEYSEKLHFSFDMIYHPGSIYAVASYADGHKKYTTVSTPGDAEQISLRADRTKIAADGIDMTFIEINARDKDGNLDAFNSDRVKVEVEGAAELVSIDSGNAVDYDSYQSRTRRLFNGKAVAYLRSDGTSGRITVRVSGVNTVASELTLHAENVPYSQNCLVKENAEKADSMIDKSIPQGKTIYARKLEIIPVNGAAPVLTAENPSAVFNYRILPENTNVRGGKIKFSAIGTEGYVRVNNASVTVDKEKHKVTVTGLKPGIFRLYGTYTNGWKQPQLLSTYTVKNESAVSNDPSLANDAYKGINAVKLDPSSNNQSYTVDYDDGVVTGIFRANDTLVYKDVEFGTDYSRKLILNCVNISQSTEAKVEVYVDGVLKITAVIPRSEASVFSKNALRKYIFPLSGITGTHDITFRNAEQGPRLCVEYFRFTASCTDPYDAYSPIKAESFDYYAAAEHVPKAAEYIDPCGERYSILEIMDNAGVYYRNVDFGDEGADFIEIRMKLTADSGNIAITIGDGREQYPDWTGMPFYKEGEYSVYRFRLDKTYTGVHDIGLFAYPGAAVYIDRFRFVKST